MPMKAQEAIRRLKREGWIEVRQTGSHKQFVKNGKRMTVPDHRGDLSPGVEKNIKQMAGWIECFRRSEQHEKTQRIYLCGGV